MTDLKLARLPDRNPVKFTISVKPELAQALEFMTVLYRNTYGEAEPVEELIPYMLQSFLDCDRNFVKAWKQQQDNGTPIPKTVPLRRTRRRRGVGSANGGDTSTPSAGDE